VRELLPQDLKLEIDQLTQKDASKAAHYLAYVVGRAHARQMEPAIRKEWCAELASVTPLGGPNWLWESVVHLVAEHEAGYLQHCRKYALHQDAE
jgi:uncharacterized protein (DUF2252 family)